MPSVIASMDTRMDTDNAAGPRAVTTGVPRPRPFPVFGDAPGPRCGHTLTTITGPDGDVSRAKLVLFGALGALMAEPCTEAWVERRASHTGHCHAC